MLGLILGIISIVLLIVFGIVAAVKFTKAYNENSSEKASKLNKRGTLFTILAVVALFMIIYGFNTYKITDAQSVYVVTEFGVVKDTVNTAGIQSKGFFEVYHKYDKKIRTTEVVREVYTSDLQAVEITFTIEYQVDPTKINDLYLRYNTLENLETLLQNPIWAATEAVASTYSARELTTLKAQYVSDVQTELSNSFNQYFINVYQIKLKNTVYTPEFEALLQSTKLAEQEILKQQAELEKQLQEAEYAVLIAEQNALEALTKAEGEANAALAKAIGEANAIKAIAEAEAMAYSSKIAFVAQSLGFEITQATDGSLVVNTDGHTQEEIDALLSYVKYLEYLGIWDGQLPTIVTDGSNLLITP